MKLYETEFPGHQVPDEIVNEPSIVDWSWHNDACPSFTWREYAQEDSDGAPRLWVHHQDPAQREDPAYPRFQVSRGEGTLYSGESLADALKAFHALR